MEKAAAPSDDILAFVIIPNIPLDFLGVSKKWREVSKQFIIKDFRLTRALVNAGFVSASKHGDLVLLKQLLAHPFANPSVDNNLPLVTAISRHHNEIAKFLLNLPSVNPKQQFERRSKKSVIFSHGSAIQAAINHNREMLDYIFSLGDFTEDVLSDAAQYGHENLVYEILDNRVKYNLKEVPSNILRLVARADREEVGKRLFERLLVEPNMDLRGVWDECTSYSHASKSWVLPLLLADPRFVFDEKVIRESISNLSTENVKALIEKYNIVPTSAILDKAIECNDIDLAKYLLEKPGWAKSVQDGFSMAARYGRFDMVDLLIKHGLYTEESCQSAMHSLAYQGAHPNMIEKLLTVLPNVNVQPYIIMALDSKNDQVALVFLKRPKIDLATQDQIYFRRACENRLVETVKFLLTAPKVNPAVQDCVGIRAAALQGHVEVVKVLLADPRVNPAAKANHAIQCAVLSDNQEIVSLLLADSRVDPSVNNNYAYTKAKSPEVKALLLKDARVKAKIQH